MSEEPTIKDEHDCLRNETAQLSRLRLQLAQIMIIALGSVAAYSFTRTLELPELLFISLVMLLVVYSMAYMEGKFRGEHDRLAGYFRVFYENDHEGKLEIDKIPHFDSGLREIYVKENWIFFPYWEKGWKEYYKKVLKHYSEASSGDFEMPDFDEWKKDFYTQERFPNRSFDEKELKELIDNEKLKNLTEKPWRRLWDLWRYEKSERSLPFWIVFGVSFVLPFRKADDLISIYSGKHDFNFYLTFILLGFFSVVVVFAIAKILEAGENSFESRESLYWRWLAFKSRRSAKYIKTR